MRICTPKSGSFDQSTIGEVIEQINLLSQKTVDKTKYVLLLLDGHSSQECLPMLELGEKYRILIVRLPANSTHFLQLCDRAINKNFQQAARQKKDELMSLCHINYSKLPLKFKLAVGEYEALTPAIAGKWFEDTGLWPIYFPFLNQFE